MNNEILTERIYLHLIKNSANNINEGSTSEVIRFVKESAVIVAQIRKLKENQELFLDLIDPVGFISIIKIDSKYEITVVIKDQKSRSITVGKPLDVYKKLFDIFKDQMTIGIKNLKLRYETHSN